MKLDMELMFCLEGALEFKDFKLSGTKTKHMECKFSRIRNKDQWVVMIWIINKIRGDEEKKCIKSIIWSVE